MVQGEDKWIPIEDITSKVVYEKLLDTRRSIREYTPNPAHKVLCEIDPYLTPEERNYWWKLTHRLISTKKTESKYKRNEQGETVEPTCPVCQEEIETLEHYNNECRKVKKFRRKLAQHLNTERITDQEWNLQQTKEKTLQTITIAKARWIYHCERCKVDHKERRRINSKVVLERLKRRIELLVPLKQQGEQTPQVQDDRENSGSNIPQNTGARESRTTDRLILT